jgi:hypothetical protein
MREFGGDEVARLALVSRAANPDTRGRKPLELLQRTPHRPHMAFQYSLVLTEKCRRDTDLGGEKVKS